MNGQINRLMEDCPKYEWADQKMDGELLYMNWQINRLMQMEGQIEIWMSDERTDRRIIIYLYQML